MGLPVKLELTTYKNRLVCRSVVVSSRVYSARSNQRSSRSCWATSRTWPELSPRSPDVRRWTGEPLVASSYSTVKGWIWDGNTKPANSDWSQFPFIRLRSEAQQLWLAQIQSVLTIGVNPWYNHRTHNILYFLMAVDGCWSYTISPISHSPSV